MAACLQLLSPRRFKGRQCPSPSPRQYRLCMGRIAPYRRSLTVAGWAVSPPTNPRGSGVQPVAASRGLYRIIWDLLTDQLHLVEVDDLLPCNTSLCPVISAPALYIWTWGLIRSSWSQPAMLHLQLPIWPHDCCQSWFPASVTLTPTFPTTTLQKTSYASSSPRPSFSEPCSGQRRNYKPQQPP